MSDLLKQVYIRAYSKDKWENVSLQDLIDRHESSLIEDWFRFRMNAFFGLKEGDVIDEATAEHMVVFLDSIGSPIVKLKP